MENWTHVSKALPVFYVPVICMAESTIPGEELYKTCGVLHECLGFFVFNEDGEPDTELRAVKFWKHME